MSSIIFEDAPPGYETRPTSPVASSSNNSTPLIPGPVTLAWNPELEPIRTPQPHEITTEYSFSQLTSNAMVLLPPPTSSDSRIRYHISVASNCFIPSAFITTIREGGTESGSFVADFQTGVVRDSYVSETVCIRGEEHPIANVMKELSLSFIQKRKGLVKLGHWQFGSIQLFWDIAAETNVKTCYSSAKLPRKKATVYARFRANSGLRHGASNLGKLEVTPEGHAFFDHILVSALILERLWLTPSLQT